MSQKTLFFISSDSFHAHVWKNGALSKPYYFTNSAEGLAQFSDFLRSHRDPAYLLVDLIEEDFRQETVPHLTGANRQALIQRKFDQHYRNTPFRLASLQHRQEEGRRDDELLFSALTNPARISSWLELLLLHNTPIVGIYSVPHVSLPLIKDVDSDHLLLLSWEKNAGLRQSYFLNKYLRFSRLTPVSKNSSFANEIATESARTHQYLQSLSLTPQGKLLNVHIICHASDKAALDARLSSNQQIQYGYLDLQQLGQQFKSKNEYSDSDATPLFLHLLASKQPRGSYAASAHTHFYQLWRGVRALFGLAAATTLISLLWSTLSFLETSEINEKIDGYTIQTSRMQHEAQQITRQFPISTQSVNGGYESTVSASDMKTVVTLFRNLQLYANPPQRILNGLTTTLADFPRISTGKISWQASAEGNLPAQEITFNGELLNFGNDYRGALNYLERFQLVLTRAGYTVTSVKMPLDLSTKGSISADINFISEKPYEFSVTLTWRPQA